MERVEAMEEKLASVETSMQHLTRSVDALVQELRVTNTNVQQLTLAQARLDERAERLAGELWTPDNGSRVRMMELHIRGLYVAVAALWTGIGAEMWTILGNWKHFLR